MKMDQMKLAKKEVAYHLESDGKFIVDDYNQATTFSNFFPGIAGLWGIPMWLFYVNRGQCVTCFGIESKDKSVMEFLPANMAYRRTALQGFRSFIKLSSGDESHYWEPFQQYLTGTHYQKRQRMIMSAYDLTIEEYNDDLKLKTSVHYYTIPEEPFSGLIRKVTIENYGDKAYDGELLDGLPAIIPFGLKDGLIKHIARTAEAWVKVKNIDNKIPYYQLRVEVSDTPEIKSIKEGNFFFSFSPDANCSTELKTPIVEAASVFGARSDFIFPENFMQSEFSVPANPKTDNKSPSAMASHRFKIKPGEKTQLVSVFGCAHDEGFLDSIVKKVCGDRFIEDKAARNQDIIEGVKNYAFTVSSHNAFNQYAEQTFLDNILRGGIPVSIKTSDGHVAFNVFSRKHGDLERDYNYFVVAPTYYSQGNGNFRDVNQNRRNDVWFNTHVQDSHIQTFYNLSQVDGYNPLVVKGASFTIENQERVEEILKKYLSEYESIKDILTKPFQPGLLLAHIDNHGIAFKKSQHDFLGELLENCHKHEEADHGEGFWSDHWTYNLDLVESYLAVYPDKKQFLLFEKSNYSFFQNTHYVNPRAQRYVLTPSGVRQFRSVSEDASAIQDHFLRVDNGKGEPYHCSLFGKMLCLAANKVATLDPSGIGIEMEADKPNWYDALNGLPGLLGSAISETIELKRMAEFMLASLKEAADMNGIEIFQELATFIQELTDVMAKNPDPLTYWSAANDLKEAYRLSVRKGIKGVVVRLERDQLLSFIKGVKKLTTRSMQLAKNDKGELATYFYHEITDYDVQEEISSDGHAYVVPKAFKKMVLPLFLEGFVHALKVAENKDQALEIYKQVRNSEIFDEKLNMYRVNADLSAFSEDIGRTRVFPTSWLENGSIWLHMEYKYFLEVLRSGLHDEFFADFMKAGVPFLKPEIYGRSILENSSFIVSSSHEDEKLHSQGFVARLSGSTAEFLHIWLYLNVGANPFTMNKEGQLSLMFQPTLPGSWFTTEATDALIQDPERQCWTDVSLPKHVYAFKFLSSTLVVYHNEKLKNTYGDDAAKIESITLTYPDREAVNLTSTDIPAPYAQDVRDHKVQKIDITLS